MSNFSDQNRSTDKGESSDIRLPFNQAAALYSGEPLSSKTKKDIQASLSGLDSCFILMGDNYIFPDQNFRLPSALIRRTIRNDKACAFRRKVDHNGQKKTLCTSYIGKNCEGEDIAVGMLSSDLQSQFTINEASFYNYTGCLKRFYKEFVTSRAIRNFLESKESYLYAIDSDTAQIIFCKYPEQPDGNSEKIRKDNQIVESILPQILSSQKATEEIGLDFRLRNLDIRKCTFYNANIILLSFTMADSLLGGSDRTDPGVSNLAGKIRGKIKTIRKAAQTLNLQKGKPINEDNLELLGIINSASRNLENLINRLELLEDKETVDVFASE